MSEEGKQITMSRGAGPIGQKKNSPKIDQGTLVRTQSQPSKTTALNSSLSIVLPFLFDEEYLVKDANGKSWYCKVNFYGNDSMPHSDRLNPFGSGGKIVQEILQPMPLEDYEKLLSVEIENYYDKKRKEYKIYTGAKDVYEYVWSFDEPPGLPKMSWNDFILADLGYLVEKKKLPSGTLECIGVLISEYWIDIIAFAISWETGGWLARIVSAFEFINTCMSGAPEGLRGAVIDNIVGAFWEKQFKIFLNIKKNMFIEVVTPFIEEGAKFGTKCLVKQCLSAQDNLATVDHPVKRQIKISAFKNMLDPKRAKEMAEFIRKNVMEMELEAYKKDYELQKKHEQHKQELYRREGEGEK